MASTGDLMRIPSATVFFLYVAGLLAWWPLLLFKN